MRRLAIALCTVGLVIGGCVTATTPEAPVAIAAAVADPARPEADTARDAARKPAEIVAFAGVEPGQLIAEISPGGGYYTRILARAVGPNGHVYALVPMGAAQRPGGLDAINAIAAAYGNVTVMPVSFTDFTVGRPVDLVWTTENYHDLNNGPTADIAAVNAAVFRALKPGGIYFVEDHAAAPGTGVSATSTLHRIDPAAVIAQVTAAGFTLEAQSDLLRNPNDPKTVGVRDPSVQGETEKFALRFRKPG